MNKLFSPLKSAFSIVLVSATVISSVFTVFLFTKNTTLTKENQSLLAESKQLYESIKKLEEENENLIANSEKEKQAIKDSLTSLKSENEALQTEIKKIGTNLDSAIEEKSYLEEILINKTKEIEKIRNGSPAALASAAQVPSGNSDELIQKIRQKEEEIRNLNDQNKTLSRKLDRLYQTTHDKIAEINIAKITLEETIAQARKIIDSEWSMVDLGSIAVNPNAPQGNKTESRKVSKKEGRVLAINKDHGFVVVDVGKVDGIKNDATLFIKKNGESIGTLSVLEVRDVMSACNIKDLSQGKKIEINDLVLTQK